MNLRLRYADGEGSVVSPWTNSAAWWRPSRAGSSGWSFATGAKRSDSADREHLLDEAPVPLVVTAVEEAAAKERVAPKAAWRNVVKLAKSRAAHRQGLWA